jgi:hypothetical protein
MWRRLSTCRPPRRVCHYCEFVDLDIPFEPVDHEPIDWDIFGGMTQDVANYFVTVDESGKSEMDYFVEGKMEFGNDEELPVAPSPVKLVKSAKSSSNGAAKRWVPTQPKARRSIAPVEKRPSKPQVRTGRRSFIKSTNQGPKPREKKIVREDLRDEVLALEREELAACANDDFGMTFDLEL